MSRKEKKTVVPRPPETMVSVRGAREHNLKNLDVDIPRDALVVFTGVSGSGKSSLAFGTLYAEAQRRYFESVSPYARRPIDQVAVYASFTPAETREALRRKATPSYQGTFIGTRKHVLHTFATSQSAQMKRRAARFMIGSPCPVCNGKRLKREALSVTFAGLDIGELSQLSLDGVAKALSPAAQGHFETAPSAPASAALSRRGAARNETRRGVRPREARRTPRPTMRAGRRTCRKRSSLRRGASPSTSSSALPHCKSSGSATRRADGRHGGVRFGQVEPRDAGARRPGAGAPRR